jgi:hypothetical protein
MTATDLYIDSNAQLTKTVEAVPSVHPALKIVYKLALSKERHAVKAKANSGDPSAIDAAETDVIFRYVVTINGQPPGGKDKVARIRPVVRNICLELVLGYVAEDETEAAENPPAAA